METAYLIIRIIRIFALLALFVMYYMRERNKNVAKIVGVIIAICGVVTTLGTIVFETILGASCLLSVFVLFMHGIILLVEIKGFLRDKKRYISKK